MDRGSESNDVRLLHLLKKQTRAHKYLHNLSKAEIQTILERHVPHLREIRVLSTPLAPPEVHDEYLELRSRIVARAREDLQNEFQKKIKLPPGSDSALALGFYLRSI
jgi:hypothetical protein